jgi:hypothetical protein
MSALHDGLIPAAARCSCDGDPIECTHEAARAQAEAALERVVALVKDMPDWCCPDGVAAHHADSVARAMLGLHVFPGDPREATS